MKRILCAILACTLLLAFPTSCGEKKRKISHASPTKTSSSTEAPIEGLEFTNLNSEGMLCLIKQDAPASVTIPFKYDGKEITSLKTAEAGCKNLKEVIVSYSLNEVASHAFQNCPALTSVTFKGNVQKISEGAFQNCPALETVTFKGSLKEIESGVFTGCPKLDQIVLPPGSQVNNQMRGNTIIGSSGYMDFVNTMKAQEAMRQAESNVAKEFDGSKEITPENAASYQDQLTGALIYTDLCPDCDPDAYSTSVIDDEMELQLWDPEDTDYMGYLITDEKTAAVKSGKTPAVHALVEAIGKKKVAYIGADNYQISYRVSFWNTDSQELLAWFTLKDLGYAPLSYNSNQKGIRFTFGKDNSSFLCDKNGHDLTPLFVVVDYVYTNLH